MASISRTKIVPAKPNGLFTGKLTDDDMFSSDLTDSELRNIFKHINIETLWVYSLGMTMFDNVIFLFLPPP